MRLPSGVARADPGPDPGDARGWRFRCHAAPGIALRAQPGLRNIEVSLLRFVEQTEGWQ